MVLEADFLVVGSGLAGLNAAIRLAEVGRVVVVTKGQVNESATAWAQGGIASVVDAHDSFEAHVSDTLLAGAGLCDPEVVHSIVTDGPRAIERLVQLGVAFDRDGDHYDLTREGGHSRRRILHTKDLTGREISRALMHRASRTPAIQLLDESIAIDLVTSDRSGGGPVNRCIGAYVLDIRSGDIHTIRAKATLLATGGSGKVYRYTTNPDIATGDGVAMAFRAGADVANMEFFQFHPTCLYHPRSTSFLVSEALRGEGGILKSLDGTPFMRESHPLADLAPRDIVARAIDQVMKRTGDKHVLLDMTHLDPTFVVSRFPNIHAVCSSLGIDMTQQPIPVVPAAHYQCGGVATDAFGATSVPGLWAAGETGCTGLHGANRLASNSLLEAVVVSERAARQMQQFAHEAAVDAAVPEWDARMAVEPDEAIVVSHNWEELRRTMWNYVGIVRSDKRLARAKTRILFLEEEIKEYYWSFRLTADLVELRNLATVARLIVACSRRRRESRGLHFNLDCPDPSNEACRPTIVRRGVQNSLVWERRAA